MKPADREAKGVPTIPDDLHGAVHDVAHEAASGPSTPSRAT